MIGKRNKLDFSKHILTVEEHGPFTTHRLAVPGTSCNALTFINGFGCMFVIGDFGNWIFDREFNPTSDFKTGVSEQYWIEKLRRSSCQKPQSFDSGLTREEIERRLADKETYDSDKEYLREMLEIVDDEFEYKYRAYADRPNTIDAEDIPYEVVTDTWLLTVFDAFEIVCELLKTHKKDGNTTS